MAVQASNFDELHVLSYKYVDRQLVVLVKKIQREFHTLRTDVIGMSDYKLIRQVKDTYEELNSDAVITFKDIESYYLGTYDYILLNDIMNKADPVTQYKYSEEVGRKRDRMYEAILASRESINASIGKTSLGTADPAVFNTAMSLWTKMIGQYAVTVADTSYKEYLKKSGVKRVQWLTAEDERVCDECDALDKQIFDIDKVPSKPHWNCRCTIKPTL